MDAIIKIGDKVIRAAIEDAHYDATPANVKKVKKEINKVAKSYKEDMVVDAVYNALDT